MWRAAWYLALATIGSAIAPPAVSAQSVFSKAATSSPPSPLLTTNRVVQASLDRIARGSPSWREAVEQVARTGRRALIVTPDQLSTKIVDQGGKRHVFDSSTLAEVLPILHGESRVGIVLVVINLRLIEDLHNARWSVPLEFEADLDRILVHEIYGHAVPYLVAGSLSGFCADPRPGERASEACSIRRENLVRNELGLGWRRDYGLNGLRLARRAH
jgi:hypothetical protein